MALMEGHLLKFRPIYGFYGQKIGKFLETSIFNRQLLLFAIDSRTFQIFITFWNFLEYPFKRKRRFQSIQFSKKISLLLDFGIIFFVEILLKYGRL